MTDPRVSVLIPTWRAASQLPDLLAALRAQSFPPHEICVIDSSSNDGTLAVARDGGCLVTSIAQEDFNHGGTRNQIALSARGDILVFMTQDALPASEHYLHHLIAPIAADRAAATYARQLPRPDSTPLARFQRLFQYPQTASERIRFAFSSNSASAVNRAVFMSVGGFPPRLPCSEDMALTLKLRQHGMEVEYVPEACVVHSHNLSLGAQFRRYFDIGAVHAQAASLLRGQTPKSEGRRYAAALLRYLWQEREWGWLGRALAESGAKWTGYHLGRWERLLPRAVKLRVGQHRVYWQTAVAGGPWQADDPRCQQLAATAGVGRR